MCFKPPADIPGPCYNNRLCCSQRFVLTPPSLVSMYIKDQQLAANYKLQSNSSPKDFRNRLYTLLQSNHQHLHIYHLLHLVTATNNGSSFFSAVLSLCGNFVISSTRRRLSVQGEASRRRLTSMCPWWETRHNYTNLSRTWPRKQKTLWRLSSWSGSKVSWV